MKSSTFKISDFYIQLDFADSDVNSMSLLPSMAPFHTTEPSDDLLFRLTVDDTLRPVKERKLVRDFDTGNGITIVQTRRYSEILDKRGAQGSLLGIGRECIKNIFENIHEESVRQQMEIFNK